MLQIKKLYEDAKLPTFATPNAAGMDLYSTSEYLIPSGGIKLVNTGIAIAFDHPGFELQIRPRSGLANKYGVTVLNSPGTIDADYRGEIKVILINHGFGNFFIRVGDRIAQAVINPIINPAYSGDYPVVREVDELPDSARGTNGMGSTGR